MGKRSQRGRLEFELPRIARLIFFDDDLVIAQSRILREINRAKAPGTDLANDLVARI
jgi:hypothetical protein